MEGHRLRAELDMEREGGRGLELGEKGGEFLENFGGSGREIEMGFERRNGGDGKGFGRRRNDLVFEGEDLFEVLLSLNCMV